MVKQRGLTLLELLIVFTIVGILWGVAIPAFSAFHQRHQATAAINRVIGAVNFARMEAVSRNQTVTLCPRENANSCGNEWRKGIIVFMDSNQNGDLEDNDELIRVTPPFPEGSSLSWSAFGSNRYLRFSPLGFTYNQNGTFTYCPPNKDNRLAKLAVINKAGRVRPSADTDGNGIVNLANGDDVECESDEN